VRCAVEVTGRTVEQLLYFDFISIQTSPCVHVEQDLKNKAHPKVDEEIKCHCSVAPPLAIRMTPRVCIAMNYTLRQLCAHCGKWAHKSCAGEDEEDVTSVHICVSCTKTIN
jgi:hypothetical protein